MLVTFVDKVAVRSYCATKGSNLKFPKFYQVADFPEELNPELWPSEFVFKPSHGCGAMVMVTHDRRPGLDYELTKRGWKWDQGYQGALSEEIELQDLHTVAKGWFRQEYEYWTFKYPEWAYRYVPRRLIVEQLIRNSDGTAPSELRLHCFGGKVGLFRVTDVVGGGVAWSFDRNGSPVDIWLENESRLNSGLSPLPVNWRDAIREAELLAEDIDYVRVDLFATDRGIYFSEMTPYPNGGFVDFRPKQASAWMARMWQLGPDKAGPYRS